MVPELFLIFFVKRLLSYLRVCVLDCFYTTCSIEQRLFLEQNAFLSKLHHCRGIFFGLRQEPPKSIGYNMQKRVAIDCKY